MTRIRFQGSIPHAGYSQPLWAPRLLHGPSANERFAQIGRKGLGTSLHLVKRLWIGGQVAASKVAISTGYWATGTPASAKAFNFDSAVPLPAWMIAPACPIRLPGGAVRPAT